MNLASIEHVLSPQEAADREKLFAKAKAGDEEVLAYMRDEWHTDTLVLDGKRLIWGGVLIGARR